MNPDPILVEQFAGQVVTDVAATISGVMINIAHKLGLYKAMAGAGCLSSSGLADLTGNDERYIREWLNNQAAGGYVIYRKDSDSYELPDHHVPVLADDDRPVFLVPALEVAAKDYLEKDFDLICFMDCLHGGMHSLLEISGSWFSSGRAGRPRGIDSITSRRWI